MVRLKLLVARVDGREEKHSEAKYYPRWAKVFLKGCNPHSPDSAHTRPR